MHATLVDPSRYLVTPSVGGIHSLPSITPDGFWVASLRAVEIATTHPGQTEFLCDAHPWLGWIPDYDVHAHGASPSHQGSMHGQDRPLEDGAYTEANR
jgi:hypothetical protein